MGRRFYIKRETIYEKEMRNGTSDGREGEGSRRGGGGGVDPEMVCGTSRPSVAAIRQWWRVEAREEERGKNEGGEWE